MNSVTQEIKDRLDIVEIVGETVKLRRSGSGYSGFCPFHDNKNTPAFVVWPESGTWKCFGACNEGGDLFDFVMKRHGWDFTTAMEYLAQRAGVQLVPVTPESQQKADEHERLYQLLEKLVVFYRHALLNTPAGKIARDYLARRAVAPQTSEQFEIGYSPNSWDSALNYLSEKGFSTAEMIAAGVLSHKEETNRYYDRFRNRLMLPIRNDKGRVVGFGARAFSDEDSPKYLNSPQNDVFDKGNVLYGLYQAKKAIREQKQVVLVEGYLDVISAHQAGYQNVVCAMGTALTERQMRLLKQHSTALIMALDADAAGEKATLRGVEVAKSVAEADAPAVFDPAGLVRNEGQFKLEIRVALLPPGEDPDDLFRTHPQDWLPILAESKPVIEHVMNALVTGKDLQNPKVKAEIADELMPIIQLVAHDIEKKYYITRLANLLHVEEASLLRQSTRSQRVNPGYAPPTQRRASPPNYQPEISPPAGISEQESWYMYCLAGLMLQPELLVEVDRELRSLRLAALDSADFPTAELKGVFAYLRGAINQDEQLPFEYASGQISHVFPEVFQRLQQYQTSILLKDDNYGEKLVGVVLRLRKRNIEYWLRELRFLLVSVQEDPEFATQQIEFFTNEVHKQTKALSAFTHAFRSRQARETLVQSLTGKKKKYG